MRRFIRPLREIPKPFPHDPIPALFPRAGQPFCTNCTGLAHPALTHCIWCNQPLGGHCEQALAATNPSRFVPFFPK